MAGLVVVTLAGACWDFMLDGEGEGGLVVAWPGACWNCMLDGGAGLVVG